MNKEIRKFKSISSNVLKSVAYYSRFNLLYFQQPIEIDANGLDYE